MHPLAPITSTNLVVPFHEVPSVEWFRRALDSLARFYRFADLDAIDDCRAGRRRDNSVCHVTFDDGHESFFACALPVLRERRIPTTLFVSPKVIRDGSNYWFQDLGLLRDRVGEAHIRAAVCDAVGCDDAQLARFSLFSVFVCLPIVAIRRILESVRLRHQVPPDASLNMSVAQLRDAALSGVVTVGAHTMNHPVLANEIDEVADAEIRDSITDLSEMLGRPVSRFAYPNGTEGLDFSVREQQLAAKYGITTAVTTDVGFVSRRTHPLAIPRGGCPSLEGDTAIWRTLRLAVLPAWDRVRALAHPRQLSQAAERRALKALGVGAAAGARGAA
jgi:peptidoglycan/xylan/chitin deacetylase (PgdA/CDA1 family)